VFNATFSNISAISWRPVLVVEEARVPKDLPSLKKLKNLVENIIERSLLKNSCISDLTSMPTIQSAKIKLKKIFTEILYGGKYILLFCIPSLYCINWSIIFIDIKM
jgi:hypothetical protein